MEFVGLERSFLNTKSMPGLQPERFHRDAKEIIHLRQVVRVFTGYGMDPGQYSYPFQLYLPEWLPESIDLHLPNEEQFHVEYTVRAQFTTSRLADTVIDPRFPGKFVDVSKYRGWRTI